MTQTIRVSLPGYNALTDTNLDHFALHADSDNVLIKEFDRGSFDLTVATNEEIINHGLGYVPFFLVYVLDVDTGKWMLVPNAQAVGSVPPYIAFADDDNLHILNFYSDTSFKYYIFYDNVVGPSGIVLSESDKLVKITKQGYDALTEKDPNNMIFHSDLNTFKILKEATSNVTYTADGAYTIAHGLASYAPTSFLLLLEFPDGFAAIVPGNGWVYSKDRNWRAQSAFIDATVISFNLTRLAGSDTALKAKYYIFETPLT
jgi:hypothetical protein